MDHSIVKQFYESGLENLALEALNNLPAAVEIKDWKMTNLFMNDVGLAIAGVRREDVIGKNSLEFVAPAEHKKFIESTNKLFLDGNVKRITHLVTNGKTLTIISSTKVVKYKGNPYSLHNWIPATDFPDLFQLFLEKEKFVAKVRAPLSREIIVLYKDQVIQFLIAEGNFVDPTLTLLSMSVHLHIQQKYVSHIIKSEFGLGFNDFINYLRLREFNRLQTDPESRRFTREGIARSAGFSSAPTFYRAQKKLYNLSIVLPK